jgi:hypothetical protein
MATKETSKELSVEERGIKALERIAVSLEDINDWVYSLETKAWSERLEWYLNEFYMIAKTKQVGGSTNRPEKSSERD